MQDTSNEYDSIVKETFSAQKSEPPPVQDEYDSIVKETFQPDLKEPLKVSMHLAREKNPDERAKAVDLASRMGLPTPVVERNFVEVQQKAEVDLFDYDDIVKNYPQTANFLAVPDNAAIAKDDVESLKNIERNFRPFVMKKKTQSYASDLKDAGRTSINDLGASSIHLAVAYGTISPEQGAEMVAELNKKSQKIRENAPDYVKKFREMADQEMGDINESWQEFVSGFSKMRQGKILGALKSIGAGGGMTVIESLDLLQEAARQPKGTGHLVTETLAFGVPSIVGGAGGAITGAKIAAVAGQMGPQVATPEELWTVPIASALGGVLGTFSGSAFTEVGSQINEALSKRGIDVTDPQALMKAYQDESLMKEIRAEAMRKGLTTAAVDSAMGLFAGKFLAKAGASKWVKAKGVAKDMSVQMGGESLSEAAGQLAREKGDFSKVNMGESMLEGVAAGGHSVAEIGVMSSIRAARYSKDPAKAAEEVVADAQKALDVGAKANALKELVSTVRDAKITKRLPGRVKEILDQFSTVGNEPATVFFQSDEWDTKLQEAGLSPVQVAGEIMGDGGKAYAEAKKTGSELEMPLTSYLTHVVKNEKLDVLSDVIRFEAAGMSPTEAQETASQLPQVLGELAKEAENEPELSVDELNEREKKEIEGEIASTLLNLGNNYQPADAKAQAAIWGSILSNLAKQEKKTPREIFEKYNLTINGKLGEQIKEYNQKVLVERQRLNEMGFYSKLSDTVSQKMGNFATREQVEGMIKDIKQDERRWSGIDKFLEGKERVSKEELLDFLGENQVKIEEKMVGADNAALDELKAKRQEIQVKFGEAQVKAEDAAAAFDAAVEQTGFSRVKASVLTNGLSWGHSGEETIKSVEQREDVPQLVKEKFAEYARAIDEKETIGLEIDDIEDQINREANDPQGAKFQRYTLPGGENYRERLFIYKPKVFEPGEKANDKFFEWAKERGIKDRDLQKMSDAQVKELETQFKHEMELQAQKKVYTSSHFGPGVLGHLRLTDRVDKDGKKLLHADEVQSDWHQDGLKRGYQKGNEKELYAKSKELYESRSALNKELLALNSRYMRMAEETANAIGEGDNSWWVTAEYGRLVNQEEYTSQADILNNAIEEVDAQIAQISTQIKEEQNAVPDAPLKKNWHEFLMKSLLLDAAKNGYDKISWSTGEQNAEHYNLAKQVDHVDVTYNEDGTYDVEAIKGQGALASHANVTKEKLEDLLGKDLAEKIVNKEGREDGEGVYIYEGQNLKVGGEGMKAFYDEMLVNYANKLGKKYGVKVEMSDIGGGSLNNKLSVRNSGDGYYHIEDANGKVYSDEGGAYENYESEEEALEILSGLRTEGTKVHSLEITPKMRAELLGQGLTLFQTVPQQTPLSPLGFYSQVEREVEKMNFKQMPGKDLAGRIKNIAGIKKDELDNLGLTDWLETQEGPVKKEDVLNFIKENGLKVDQIVLSPDYKKAGSSSETENIGNIEWSEPERDHSNDHYDIESEYDNYMSDDYWWEERGGEKEQQRELLLPDYTDEDGNVDESGLEDALEEKRSEIAQKMAEENVESDDYYSARYEVTGTYTDIDGYEETVTLYGSDEYEWSDKDGNSLGRNLNEAQVKMASILRERGELDADLLSYSRAEDLEFYRVLHNITSELKTLRSLREKKAKLLLKEKKEEYQRKARENYPSEYEGKTQEEIEDADKNNMRILADEEARAFFLDPNRKENKLRAIIKHPALDIYIRGNNVKGWTLEVKVEGSDDDAKIFKIESKLDTGEEATTDQDFFKEIEKVLVDNKFVSERKEKKEKELEPVDDVNTPRGKSKFGSYKVKNGSNYRELLFTVPSEEWFKESHWEQPNVVAHARVTDRETPDGKRVLFVEEVQSDWHQKGRERGYANDEEFARVKKEYEDIQKQRDEAKQRSFKTFDEISTRIKEITKNIPSAGSFSLGVLNEIRRSVKSGSWDEGMTKERLGAELYDVLFADEQLAALTEKYNAESSTVEELNTKALDAKKAYEDASSRVPDAPYKQTEAWATLVMKRMMKLATEGGYDVLAWSPASVQVERWGTDDLTWVKKEGYAQGSSEIFRKELSAATIEEHPDLPGKFYFKTSDGGRLTGTNFNSIQDAEVYRQEQLTPYPYFLVGSVEQRGGQTEDGINIEELARARGQLLERRGEVVRTKEDLAKIVRDTLGRERTQEDLKSLTDNIWEQMQVKETGQKAPRKEGMEFFYDNVLTRKVVPAILKKLDKNAKVAPVDLVDVNAWGVEISPDIKTKAQEGFTLYQSRRNDDGGFYAPPEHDNQIDFALPEKVEIKDATVPISLDLAKAKEFAKSFQGKSFKNKHTGWDIKVSSDGLRKSGNASSRFANQVSLVNLDKVLEGAVYMTKTPDRKERRDIIAFHTFYAPIKTEQKNFLVRVTVKETKEGFFYHDRQAEEIVVQSQISGTSTQSGDAASDNGTNTISIDNFKTNVNAIRRKIDPYFHGDAIERKGSIQFNTGGVNISLFKNADFSTFLHETGHFFLEVMGDLAQAPDASQQIKDDYAAILNYLGVKDRSELKTEHHELWARSFEAYLREGRAPSLAMRDAFARFRVWLLDIYKRISLNVTLSDEIRSVMDRMIATEEEIAKVQGTSVDPIFKNPDTFGLTGVKAEKYLNAVQEAEDASKAHLNDIAIRQIEREKTTFYRDQKNIKRDRIRAELEQTNLYKALAFLQYGTKPDKSPLDEGTTPFKLSREEIVENYGQQFLKRLRHRGVSQKGGMSLDLAAEMLGFESGDVMMTTIANAPTLREAVEAQADMEMKQEYPDLFESAQLSEEVTKALHNDKHSQLLRLQLQHLVENNLPVMKDVIRQATKRVPSSKEVKAEAHRIIGKRIVKDVRPHLYYNAEKKAAKEAGVKLAQGDFEGAYDAKLRELLNHELYKAAIEFKELMTKFDDHKARFYRPDDEIAKSREVDYVNAIRAILTQFGLGKGKADKSAMAYLDSIKKYDPSTYETIYTIVSDIAEFSGDYKELSVESVERVIDSVNALWDLAKSARQIEIDGKMVDVNVAREEVKLRALEVLGETGAEKKYRKSVEDMDKTKIDFLGIRARLRRIEHWAVSVDGNESTAMRRNIYRPIIDGTTKYRLAKEKTFLDLQKIFKTYKDIFKKGKIASPELNFEFQDKAQLLGALLHRGNESNFRKLLLGYEWGTIDDEGVLDDSKFKAFETRLQREGVLSKQDYDFLQAMWNLNETLKPEAQKAHKKMYGHYFSEITANEFETPYGVYRGGYVPAIVDQYLNSDASARAEKEAVSGVNNSYTFPTTGRGFTKSRVQRYVAPLAMDVRLASMHLDKVLRFIHIEPRVKDVMKIVSDKEVRGALEALDRTTVSDVIIPALQRAATQRVVESATGFGGRLIDRTFKVIRKRVGLHAMFLNFANTIQQVTGFSAALVVVKPHYVRNALYKFSRSPADTAKSVREKSDFMKTRTTTQVMEVHSGIEKIALDPGLYKNTTMWFETHGYVLQSAAQNVVDNIVWVGAYEQAIESGSTEQEAVWSADEAVRTTQGSMNPEDVSTAETGRPFTRLFLMFAGYFNNLANLNYGQVQTISREVGLRKGAGKLFYVYLMGFMIPAVLGDLILKALQSSGLDEDDDDEYMDDFVGLFFGSQMRMGFAMVPGAGPVLNNAINQFNDKPFDDRLTLSPAVTQIEKLAHIPYDVYEAATGDLNKKRATQDAMSALALAGVPMGQVSKTAGYLIDYNEGKADPETGDEFMRGLLTGR
jgi:hypothetical protein